MQYYNENLIKNAPIHNQPYMHDEKSIRYNIMHMVRYVPHLSHVVVKLDLSLNPLERVPHKVLCWSNTVGMDNVDYFVYRINLAK